MRITFQHDEVTVHVALLHTGDIIRYTGSFVLQTDSPFQYVPVMVQCFRRQPYLPGGLQYNSEFEHWLASRNLYLQIHQECIAFHCVTVGYNNCMFRCSLYSSYIKNRMIFGAIYWRYTNL